MTTTSSSRAHRLGRRSGLTIALSAALIVPSIMLTASGATAAPVTQNFALTGDEQTFVVPAGVTSIDVVATGGRGSSGTSASPGRAAQVTGTITVTPGQTLYVNVGGNGGAPFARFNGGGLGVGAGGGASDVRTSSRINGTTSLESRLLVAAGGGGAGAFDAPGGNAGANGSDSDALGCDGGDAGTATQGGASGGGNGGATSGSLGQGGDGGNTEFGRLGGGGGGGLYGGGGGGSIFIGAGGCGAGGGGGSNLVPSGGSATLAAAGSTPSISFTYEIVETTPPSLSGLSATPDPATTGEAVTVSATADDTGGSDVASAEYSLDGGAWTATTATDGGFDEAVENITASIDTTPLSQQSHEVCVRATDAAGNQTPTPLCTTFTVQPPDTSPPSVSGVDVAPNPARVGDVVTLSASATDDSDIDSASYSLDGVPATNMSAADGAFDETSEDLTVDVDTTLLSPGEHTFCVLVTDAEGNDTDGTDCVSWTLRAVGDGDGDGDGDDGDGDSDGAGDDDDEGEDDDSTLPDTGASDAPVAYGLGGLIAIAVGGLILTQTRIRPRHRA